jgi:hypothetical protein
MTFQKMISQLDIIANTMKIMDQRIQTVENQVTDLYHTQRAKKSQTPNESFSKKVPINNVPNQLNYMVNSF